MKVLSLAFFKSRWALLPSMAKSTQPDTCTVVSFAFFQPLSCPFFSALQTFLYRISQIAFSNICFVALNIIIFTISTNSLCEMFVLVLPDH